MQQFEEPVRELRPCLHQLFSRPSTLLSTGPSKPLRPGTCLLRKGPQELSQVVRLAVAHVFLERSMQPLPHRYGACQQGLPPCRQQHPPAASIFRVRFDPHQASALEGLESSGQRRPIHAEKRSQVSYPRRHRPVQRHQQGKLPVGQAQRAQPIIEAPSQRSGSSLDMKAEASVAHQERCLESRLAPGCHVQIIEATSAVAKRPCSMYVDINVSAATRSPTPARLPKREQAAAFRPPSPPEKP
jgi:hypothetical protein